MVTIQQSSTKQITNLWLGLSR